MSKDYREFATKAPSKTMAAFADFVIAEVYGGKLPAGVDEKSFRAGIALGGSLRMDFQKSDFWKGHADNYLANVEANRAAKAAEAVAKAEAAQKAAEERVAKAKAKADAAVKAAEAAAKKAAANATAKKAA